MLAGSLASTLTRSGLRMSARLVTSESRRVWRVTVRRGAVTLHQIEDESISEALVKAASLVPAT
jgi:hypothetical protein